jgi:anthranilate phosphoribosyltransferase
LQGSCHHAITLQRIIPSATTNLSPAVFTQLLKKLVLTPLLFDSQDASLAFSHLITPSSCTSEQIASFLTALRVTRLDLSPDVILPCARIMRDVATRVEKEDSLGEIADIVGTGGDGKDTFNASTAAGIVCAGAGLRVVKVSDDDG